MEIKRSIWLAILLNHDYENPDERTLTGSDFYWFVPSDMKSNFKISICRMTKAQLAGRNQWILKCKKGKNVGRQTPLWKWFWFTDPLFYWILIMKILTKSPQFDTGLDFCSFVPIAMESNLKMFQCVVWVPSLSILILWQCQIRNLPEIQKNEFWNVGRKVEYRKTKEWKWFWFWFKDPLLQNCR